MTFADAIIIYLTCGSPFGVHYYLNNRKSVELRSLAPKTVIAVLLWPAYAIALFSSARQYSTRTAQPDSDTEKRIREIRNSMEKSFLPEPSAAVAFEFREIFDRYAGLTLALRDESEAESEAIRELARISKHKDPHLAAVCLNRRNRKRLSFHQTEARNDFLAFVFGLWDSPAAAALAMELAGLLSDAEAQQDLQVILTDTRQTQPEKAVSDLEKVLWKSHAPKPLPAARRSGSNLRTMTATASSRIDD